MDYGLAGQNTQVINDISFNVNINGWLIYLLAAVLFIFFLLILRKIILFLSLNSKYHNQIIYLLRVPKEKPNEKEQQGNMNYVQRLREQIARAETIFKAIGGLRAERWYKNFSWLIGRTDHFSFEIVANSKFISFYVVAPRAMGRYIEQQIQAYYPEAVLEETEDYNIFSARGQTVAGFIKTKRSFIFPLKTYNKMETDPLESLINVLSKLNVNESIAIQYIVRSALPSWHYKSNRVVSRVNQGKKLSDALGENFLANAAGWLGDLAKAAKPSGPDGKKMEKENRLTVMEQEVLKLIEEKNSKAGLNVNVRIVASAGDSNRARAYLNNMISAFSGYNYYQYGNIFSNKVILYNKLIQKFLIKDFIYRRFKPSISFLLNTEELASLFHPPLPETETPNILWLFAKYAAAPSNVPGEGIILGKNIYRDITTEIKMKREDRRRHTYVIGKSGVGKSVLLASMAIQDITNGEGVCVIDPHGDLIDDIISRIPPERAGDVILFAPADMERPLALNLLEFDPRLSLIHI